jgi:cell division protein FtsQ
VQQPASKEQLKQRRRQFRQQRRVKVVKSLWRLACMSGILAGLGWVVSQADWRISKPEQVRIQGNQYLSDATIRDWLAIPYPKLMMELAPAELTARLLERGSIASVKIDRALLPPHLIVRVEDSPPVARIIREDNTDSQIFVDELGRQLPFSSYHSTVWRSPPKLALIPPLKGICPEWKQLYHAIQTSPVAIGIIDCHNPQNIILQTELGKVRLGAIGDKSLLNNQLQQLDRLREWKKHIDPTDIDYLDLENPDAPKFQLKRSAVITSPSSE